MSVNLSLQQKKGLQIVLDHREDTVQGPELKDSWFVIGIIFLSVYLNRPINWIESTECETICVG